MKESQMFEMDRKLQIAQNKYDNKKGKYVDIIREMIEKSKTEINGLDTSGYIDKYAEKMMRIG